MPLSGQGGPLAPAALQELPRWRIRASTFVPIAARRQRLFSLAHRKKQAKPGKPPPERSGGLHNAPTGTLPACSFASRARRYLPSPAYFAYALLVHQIENGTYQKTLLNQTNFERVLPAEIRDQARLAVKDE